MGRPCVYAFPSTRKVTGGPASSVHKSITFKRPANLTILADKNLSASKRNPEATPPDV